jgi:hypothetical protein
MLAVRILNDPSFQPGALGRLAVDLVTLLTSTGIGQALQKELQNRGFPTVSVAR